MQDSGDDLMDILDGTLDFAVTLGRASSVTVDYATSDGTATAGEDYTAAASGTLTFTARF